MKIKKIIYATFVLFLFSIISCASTPKQQEEISKEETPSSIIEEIEINAEKIEEDILPELPPLEEENIIQKEDDTQSLEEETVLAEPVKKEETQEDIIQLNNTDINNTESDNLELNEDSKEDDDNSEINSTTETDNSIENSSIENINNLENDNLLDSNDSLYNSIEPDENTEIDNNLESDNNLEIDDSLETEDSLEINEELNNEIESNEIQQKTIEPSRSMSVLKNQFIDITYPGTGWIYLGQDNNKKDITFHGRKLGGKDTSFTVRAKNAGTHILHFYKNDPLTNSYIDDYIEITVSNEITSSQEHIKAPDYKDYVPAKIKQEKKQSIQNEKSITIPQTQEESNNTSINNGVSTERQVDSNIQTVIQNTQAVQNQQVESNINETVINNAIETSKDISLLNEEELLKLVKEEFNNNNHKEALRILDVFFEKTTTKIDEGLYLQGQILESKSSVQNIKGAIDSYDLLIKNYPSSNFWNQANKRSIFLKRFYINIR